jgi:hypothetical protein
MRRSWIAIVTIALLVGLVTVYRTGRPGIPPREPLPAADDPEPPREASRPEATYPSPRVAPRRAASAREPATPPTEARAADVPPVAQAAAIDPVPLAAPVAVAGLLRPDEAAAVRAEPPVPTASAPVSAPTSLDTSQAANPARIEEPIPSAETAVAPDDPHSDRQVPALESLRFDPQEINDGRVAMLSVGASDDLSGVKLVFGTLESPSGAADIPFTAEDATGSGLFTAGIAVPQRAETGDWFVGTLRIIDRADNALTLAFERSTVPQGGTLRVVSEESDSEAPDVRGVAIDKGQLDPGETNRIMVTVEDDRSGVASVTGAFQNPSKSAFIPFTCRPNGSPTSWVSDVPVPANADCGEWTLRHLRVADNANNTAELSGEAPPLGGASFVVASHGACDSEPPIIDAMSFSPAIVTNTVATEILLTVEAHDDGSGVASLFGRIEGPAAANGQVAWIRFECAPNPGDPRAPMTATVSVPQYASRGVWSVVWVQVTDKARNSHPYYKDAPALAGARFTVE